MSIEELIELCPPPVAPVNVPSPAQWDALEANVGSALPSDYKAFLARYGSGCFGSDEPGGFFDLAFVLSPGQPADEHQQNAVPEMRKLTETLGRIRRTSPKRVPVPAWPEVGGLLYAGGTTTRNDIYWKTAGAADAWTCMVADEAWETWFAWEGNLTSLLAAIVTGRVPAWLIAGPTRFPLVFRDLASLANARLV